ncbi:hypothetical protein SJPD1_1905 [Sulfurospirillum diekertiae]|uniref:RloB domain-containing protein n=1 Tax=Sulfurospirillum diekertiae TaxID=1854492 RepID=A0A290HWH5_9BACT|nr:RloB family protein [Sulfurospirillum diekertiae]ATB70010.1 hypothetical protein SJPD1_1905 [Sulfurospirillum diekertiae]
MGFKERSFTQPIYIEESIEAKKAIIISCEGRVTEFEYFNGIKNNLSSFIDVVLEIHVIPKYSNASEPKDIVKNLEEYITNTYDYKNGHDECWLVLDREKVPERKTNILAIVSTCKSKNYNIAITNPTFEFWLLLHLENIEQYDKEVLFKNDNVNTKRKFIDKELSNRLLGYNKRKGCFPTKIITKENIQRALEQEKLFENEFEKILDKLGSNVGKLINKIVQFD